MSDDEGAGTKGSHACPQPKNVIYHPVTGVPEEFNDYLHKDSEEYKRLREHLEASTSGLDASAVADEVAALDLDGKGAKAALDDEAAKAEEKKKKKKSKDKDKEVIITRAQRQRKKCITTVEGLDVFGVKLADAAKIFGKKYACGSSVVKNPSLKEQIDIQGDVQELLPELILKQYGDAHSIQAKHIIMIIEKERVRYEP